MRLYHWLFAEQNVGWGANLWFNQKHNCCHSLQLQQTEIGRRPYLARLTDLHFIWIWWSQQNPLSAFFAGTQQRLSEAPAPRMARIQMAPTTCAEIQREFSSGNNQKTSAIEAAMMWIYDKERLGMHRTHIQDKFLKPQQGASVENIHKITKTTGKRESSKSSKTQGSNFENSGPVATATLTRRTVGWSLPIPRRSRLHGWNVVVTHYVSLGQLDIKNQEKWYWDSKI